MTSGLAALSPACSVTGEATGEGLRDERWLVGGRASFRPASGCPVGGLPSRSAGTAHLPALPLNSLGSSG